MASTSSLTAGELAVKLTLDSKAFYKDLKELEKAVDALQAKYQAVTNAVSGAGGKKGAGTGNVTAAVQSQIDPALSSAITDIANKLNTLTGALQQSAQQQQAHAAAVNDLLKAYQKSSTAAQVNTTTQQQATNAKKSSTSATTQATAATAANTAATNASTTATKGKARSQKDAEASAISLTLREADLAQAEGRWQDSIRLTEEALDRARQSGKLRELELIVEKKLVDRQADAEIQLADAKGKRLAKDVALTTQSTKRATVENQILNAAVLRASEERKNAATLKDQTAQTDKLNKAEKALKAVLDSSTAGVRAQTAARKELAAIQKARADLPKAAANAALEDARRKALELAATQKDLAGAAQVLNNALLNQNTRLNASKSQIRETSQLLNSLKREMAGVTSQAANASKVNYSDLAAKQALSDAKILQTQYAYVEALQKLQPAIKDVNVSQDLRNKLLERQAELLQRVSITQAAKFTQDENALDSIRRAESSLNQTLAAVRSRTGYRSSADDVQVLTAQLSILKRAQDEAERKMGAFASEGSNAYRAVTREVGILTKKVAEAELRQQVNNLKSAQGFFRTRLEIIKTRDAIARLSKTAGPEAITRALNEVQRAAGRTNVAMSVLRGVIGGVFGGFTAYSIIQTITRQLTQFTIQSTQMANSLEVTSFSSKLVAKDLKTYADILQVAEANQKIFGGTLNENIGNLTGFTLIARTAGVDFKNLVGIAQRLALFDPVQGISGASTALREFLAGNIRSLRERFELPANVLKQLGDQTLSTEERLKRLSDFLDTQGLSLDSLSGKLGLTAQAYQNFAISFERSQTAIGSSLATFFAPFAQQLSDQLDRASNDFDQLARDYYGLSAAAQLSDSQRAMGAELAAERIVRSIALTEARIERVQALYGALMAIAQQSVILAPLAPAGRALGEETGLIPAEGAKDVERFNERLSELAELSKEILKTTPELKGEVVSIFQEFNFSDKTEKDLRNLEVRIQSMYNTIINRPKAIIAAREEIENFFKADPSFDKLEAKLLSLIEKYPDLSLKLRRFIADLRSGKYDVDETNARIQELIDSVDMGTGEFDDLGQAVKNASLQYVESQIQAYQTEKSQKELVRVLDQVALSTNVTADEITNIANLLGIEESKVLSVVDAWRELRNARSLGMTAADEIAAIESSMLPDSVKAQSIASVYERVYAEIDFEAFATDQERLAAATERYNKALDAAAARGVPEEQLRFDPRVVDAYKEMVNLQAKLTSSSRSGGSSQVDNAKTYTEKLADILTDYQSDMLDEEAKYQQKILDIQKSFYDKQKIALQKSETGKRSVRVSTYRALMDSELTQAQQQQVSAAYEGEHELAMQLASEGKVQQSQDLLDLARETVETDIDFLQEINKAVEAGDTARAEALGVLYQIEKDRIEIERRNLLEGGDANVNEYNEAMTEANNEHALAVDAINLKYSDRAKELLESEPKIIELLGGTNEALSKQAEVLQKMADYSSPVERGLDGIATNAANALTEVKKLIDYMRVNNIGQSFSAGVATGVKDGEGEVVDAAKSVVNSATEGAQEELQARSPSRRTMKQVGRPFVDGIIKGISTASGALNRTVTSVINGAVTTAQSRLNDLPAGIRKTQENIDAFKNIAQTNISILQGLRELLPDREGAAQGRASYVAAMAKIDQDTEAQITARREKLSRDILLARTEDERRILEAIAQQDIALLQQQANIQKSAQDEELRNAANQEAIDAKMAQIQASAAERLRQLQERMAELARTNPEEAARLYQLRAQQILDVANLRQELERYLLENNLTSDDAFASLLRQQIQQVQALGQMEIQGVNVGNAPINNTVYNISMDLTGSSLRREEVRTIVRQELSRALANSRGSTA